LLATSGKIPTSLTDLEEVFDGENNAPDEDRNATLNFDFDFRPNHGNDFVLPLGEI
jgi:hypothetical protein